MSPPAFIWMILLPLVTSPLVYLIGHFGRRVKRQHLVHWTASVVLFATWIPFTAAALQAEKMDAVSYAWGDLSLEFDGISVLLAFVALLLGTLVVIFSKNYISGESGQEKFYAMLVALIGVMFGLGCATDLFNLWIWFEAMAVTSYLLVAYYHKRATSLEAGFKYLVQSAAGSVLVLFGIGLVLSRSSSLTLDAIGAQVAGSRLALVAGVLFVVGYGVKTALVPLHTWLPDAHSQAPSGISAMLSGVVIEAGLIAMLRTLSPLVSVSTLWGPLLILFGSLNMVAGNLLAYGQAQVKRMLAYSSVTHVGYMLIGLGITFWLRESSGAQAGLFHLVNHGMMKGLAFLAAGSLLYSLHSSLGEQQPLLIGDLAGAARRYPLAAFTFSIAVLSLAGLPPLAGFMSKWLILKAGFESHQPVLWAVVAFVAINSVFSLSYYAPVVNVLYRRESSTVVERGVSLPATMVVPLVLLTLAIVVIGVWPSVINWLIAHVGEALLAGFGV